jgi:transposase
MDGGGTMSAKTYREWNPDQALLMPPVLREWLPKGHRVYFILDTVKRLDLSAILNVYEQEGRGYPPYHPQMMVGVLLYAYCKGVPSSRRIQRRLEEDIAFRVLAAGNTPDFRTISDFRKRQLEALQGLFVQVLRLCQKAGLVKLGHVAMDGTKMKANASKHKAMSYGRMQKEEERLKQEVEALLRRAEEEDAREDALYGKDKRGDELPEELANRETRLKKIQEAMEALKKEAEEKAEQKKKEIVTWENTQPHRGRPPQNPDPTPLEKAQRNFTDPESRIMPNSDKAFIQGYNAQAVVDSACQVIVAEDVTQQTNDKQQAEPMMDQVPANTGQKPKKASLDAGYFSETNVEGLEGDGIEAFIPPDRQKHGQALPPTVRGRPPNNLTVAERMRRKLQTKRGRAIYSRRKAIVEPVFGQIKQGRGFRQFLLRGMEKVKGEWSLICTTHNLLKLWGSGKVIYAVG